VTSQTRTLAQRLAEFAANLSFDDLPSEVVQSVKLRVLDTLGVCLASRHFGLADGVQEMVDAWGGAPQAQVIGAAQRCPAPNAALVNGTLAHSLDFDDTHLKTIIHPAGPVAAAALATGRRYGHRDH